MLVFTTWLSSCLISCLNMWLCHIIYMLNIINFKTMKIKTSSSLTIFFEEIFIMHSFQYHDAFNSIYNCSLSNLVTHFSIDICNSGGCIVLSTTLNRSCNWRHKQYYRHIVKLNHKQFISGSCWDDYECIEVGEARKVLQRNIVWSSGWTAELEKMEWSAQCNVIVRRGNFDRNH